jgi:hypothetical protein
MRVLPLVVLFAGALGQPPSPRPPDCGNTCIDTLRACRKLGSKEAIHELLTKKWPLMSVYLFSGRAIKTELVPPCEDVARITFRVKRAWRGEVGETFTLTTGRFCDEPYPFASGRTYVVAAWSLESHPDAIGLMDCPLEPREGAGAAEAEFIANTTGECPARC